LKIVKITWSKNVVNNEKKLSSLIVKIYNVEQIDYLIKDDFLHDETQISCEFFINNCKIKQLFYCQKYDHIDKICYYEKWCFVCFKFYNDFTCKMSMNKKNPLFTKTIIRFDFFNARSKWSKKINFQTFNARNQFYTRQNLKKRRRRLLIDSTLSFNRRLFVMKLRHRHRLHARS
jgi:hypothetical protein